MFAVDAETQRLFDQNAAEYAAGSAELVDDLEARRAEVAERVRTSDAELAAIGQDLTAELRTSEDPVRRPEDENIPAGADYYGEPDEDSVPPSRVAVPPQPARRAPRRPAPPADEENFTVDDWLV